MHPDDIPRLRSDKIDGQDAEDEHADIDDSEVAPQDPECIIHIGSIVSCSLVSLTSV